MAVQSNKDKKRSIRAGVEALRARPGWDPTNASVGRDGLAHAQQADRSASVYANAETCESCHQQRTETGDETSLCDEHLAAAMGI